MILETKINIKTSLEELLSKIPPTNVVSPIVERRYLAYTRSPELTTASKLWFLDGAMKDLAVYSGVTEVSEWLNENKKFFSDNYLSVRACVISESLAKSKDSDFFKTAKSTLDRLLSIHSEKTLAPAIIESMSSFSWIPDIRFLIEESVKIAKGVNLTDSKVAVSKVYSPICIHENSNSEEYTFYSSKRYLKYSNGKISLGTHSNVDNIFESLVAAVERFDIHEDSVSMNLGDKKLKVQQLTEGKAIFLGDTQIQPSSLETVMFSSGSLLNRDRSLNGIIASVYENFDSLLDLDFATKLSSRIHEGVHMVVFKTPNCIAVQKVNPYMNENTFLSGLTAEEAISEAKEFLGFDISTLFSDLLESSERQKAERISICQKLEETAVSLLNKKEKFALQAVENGVEEMPEVVEALNSLQSEYEENVRKIQSIIEKDGRIDSKMSGKIFLTSGQRNVEFSALDYLSEANSIKVHVLPERTPISIKRSEIIL